MAIKHRAPVLCDELEGWGVEVGGKEAKGGGDVVYLQLIHVVIQQKLTQCHKAIILQFKKKEKKSEARAFQFQP